jgi:hypothetical protein
MATQSVSDMKKNRWIPFSWMPGSWGLHGKTRQLAEIEYYYDGYDAEMMACDVHNGEGTPSAQLAQLEVMLKWNKITQDEYRIKSIELLYTDPEERQRELDLYELDKKIDVLEGKFRMGELQKHELEKEIANLRGEPFVTVVDLGLVEENLEQGFFELDWNDKFVAMLHSNGFSGHSDEDVVNKWFNQICRTIIMQERADYDFGFQEAETDVIKKSDLTQPGQGDTPESTG